MNEEDKNDMFKQEPRLRDYVGDIDEPVEDVYQRYYLISNPFPTSGIASEEDKFFSSVRKNVLDQLFNLIVDAIKSERWKGCTIIGDTGYGKTHILYNIKSEINEVLSTHQRFKAKSFYLKKPGITTNNFYRHLIDAIGLINLIYECKKIIIENSGESEDIFTDYNRTKPTSFHLKILERIIKNKNLAKCLAVLIAFELETKPESMEMKHFAERFIRGEKLNDTERKKLGLSAKELDRYILTNQVIGDVFSIFKSGGYKMIFILLDEFESLAEVSKQKQFEIIEDLRTIIDNNQHTFSLILASTDNAWGQLRNIYLSFADRLKQIITLEGLSINQTKLLAEDFLNDSRIDNYSGDILYPFTHKSIEQIQRKNRGNIRDILKQCHSLIEVFLSFKEEKIDDIEKH